jgi:hypothetical protein
VPCIFGSSLGSRDGELLLKLDQLGAQDGRFW